MWKMWINLFLYLAVPLYERIACFPLLWINLNKMVNISCTTLIKLWKMVDNKCFIISPHLRSSILSYH